MLATFLQKEMSLRNVFGLVTFVAPGGDAAKGNGADLRPEPSRTRCVEVERADAPEGDRCRR